MRVGRVPLIALCVAIIAAASLLALRGGGASSRPPSAQQTRAVEAGALHHLALPRSFAPMAAGCPATRCYVVGRPASRVAAVLPAMMRAGGIRPPGRLRAAEPLAQLRRAHWTIGSSDPMVVACKTVSTNSGWRQPVCQDAGRVGSTLVNVLVEPYQPCHHPSCTQLGRSEVLTWAVDFTKTG